MCNCVALKEENRRLREALDRIKQVCRVDAPLGMLIRQVEQAQKIASEALAATQSTTQVEQPTSTEESSHD